jgi:hypothetical protein
MAPLRQILPFIILVGRSLIQLSKPYCHDISPAGHVDDGGKLANPVAENQSVR